MKQQENILNKNLGNIVLQNEDAYFYLSSLNLRIEKLSKLHKQLEKIKILISAIEKLNQRFSGKINLYFIKTNKKMEFKKIRRRQKKILIEH